MVLNTQPYEASICPSPYLAKMEHPKILVNTWLYRAFESCLEYMAKHTIWKHLTILGWWDSVAYWVKWMAIELKSRIQFPSISGTSFPCCYSAQNGSGVTQLECKWPFTSTLCKDPDCRQLYLHAPYM